MTRVRSAFVGQVTVLRQERAGMHGARAIGTLVSHFELHLYHANTEEFERWNAMTPEEAAADAAWRLSDAEERAIVGR